MMNFNLNINKKPTSLQISRLENIPQGDYKIFKTDNPVLIKNITSDPITVEAELADNPNNYIATVFYPGWNPELIIGLRNVQSKTLQAGN